METKQFFFPENGGGFGGGSAMEGAMFGSMMGNGGMMGGNGMWNNPIWAIVFLAALRNGGIFGNNGNGTDDGRFNALQEQLNTIQGQNALMGAIQGSTNEVKTLATTLNCDFNAVQGAINSVQSAICNLGSRGDMNAQGIITAVNNGDRDIISKLCDCCCENRLAISQQTNTLSNGQHDLGVAITKGFCDTAYAFRDQTCSIEKNADANTRAILAKLDAIEDSRKDRELAEKDRIIATLTARSERQAELQPIYSALQEIQCNQPPVKKICCPENYVPVNNSINATYGLIPTGCGGFFGGAFANPYGFGCNNGFTNGF